MKTWLRTHFNLPKYMAAPLSVVPDPVREEDNLDECAGDIRVLYDRPSDHFCPNPSAQAKHELMERLGFDDMTLFPKLVNNVPFTEAPSPRMLSNGDEGPSSDVSRLRRTVLTTRHSDGTFSNRRDAAGILVSATSWTEDEDFELLFESLQSLDRALGRIPIKGDERASHPLMTGQEARAPPRVLVVITGKGPLKEYYEARFAALETDRLSRVAVRMPWLEPEDYPTMIACADLGLSLHTSTSGLDLPMKVLDMFGAGVPVAALSFPSLPELVRHGDNGYIFKSNDSAQRQELPTLHMTLRKLLVQAIAWRYGQVVEENDYLESPRAMDTHHRVESNNRLNVFAEDAEEAAEAAVAALTHGSSPSRLVAPRTPPRSPVMRLTPASRTPPTRIPPALIDMQADVALEAQDPDLRWDAQWERRMRPVIMNMVFNRLKGPSIMFATFRLAIFTAVWMALLYTIIIAHQSVFGVSLTASVYGLAPGANQNVAPGPGVDL